MGQEVLFFCSPRDDIVFFIFLYQRYIYKEDKSRVNEFGYSADMIDEGNNPEQEANIGEIEDENSQLALTEEKPVESKEENADSVNNSGAWKNSQKQKSKKVD